MEQTPLPPKNEYPLLSSINSPDDVKALAEDQIPALCDEIRHFLIHRVIENGGHLASNLGVVELTLAIHRVFSSPHDHIIFDVGHQSYVHKLVTGRREQFDTLRQSGGLSGFPKRSESEHDAFGSGHSSTSLSASLGFAEADRLSGSDAYTVCIFGDGAYTGGMIHEALNNCHRKLKLIIILNENEMSISKNIGKFAKSLSKLRSTAGYFRTKNATVSVLNRIPFIGKPLFNGIKKFKMGLKAMLYGSNYFEDLGLYYLGPVDGNDEAAVERLLKEAKASGQSCVIHLKTKKGKGYEPAEVQPDQYHGIAAAGKATPDDTNFSDTMGNILCEMAENDEKICAITAAMMTGTGLTPFHEKYPTRFFDVGIAEEHAVTFAAGLCASGYKPVVAIYSTFLQRAYDNILHDVALQNLPVVFCIDRTGLNPSDGATHHGLFDVAFLSQVPGMAIYTPATKEALRRAMADAMNAEGPVAIRYPSGYEKPEIAAVFYGEAAPREIAPRKNFTCPSEELDAVIITHGRVVSEALAAADIAAEKGQKVGIILLEKIAPYAEVSAQILPLLPKKTCKILLLEEEIKAGGFGMMMKEALLPHTEMQNKELHILAPDNTFVVQTKNESIYKTAGVDRDKICEVLFNN